MATGSTLASEDRICGRKKLPFAGYSVVKESVKRSALRLPGGPNCGPLLSKLVGSRHSQQARSFLRARRHSPELAIVTSASPERKLKHQSVFFQLAGPSPTRSAFALRATARHPSRQAVWPAEPKPASSGFFSGQTSTGRRLVENTGLEPVTSWLQTRRSPS